MLEEAYRNATTDYEHEHVRPYMYYSQNLIERFESVEDTSHFRITLNTPEDWEVIDAVYNTLYRPGNNFTLDDTIQFPKQYPEVVAINS